MSEEQTSTQPEETQEQAEGTTPETVEGHAEESKPAMIPKQRLDAEIAKRRELEKAAKELETLKQQQADAEAEKAGQIDKFKSERDQFKEQAERWTQYATTKLEALSEDLDDNGKAILEDLGDDVPLEKRLALVERLTAQSKKPSGFGSNGGQKSADAGGLIPPEARTSRSAYEAWLGEITTSGRPEDMAVLVDTNKRKALEAEARKLFG